MNDLIRKGEFLTSLISCKWLSLKSFELISEYIENYPTEVNMDNIKKQIEDRKTHLLIGNDEVIRVKDVIDILDKGGV